MEKSDGGPLPGLRPGATFGKTMTYEYTSEISQLQGGKSNDNIK